MPSYKISCSLSLSLYSFILCLCVCVSSDAWICKSVMHDMCICVEYIFSMFRHQIVFRLFSLFLTRPIFRLLHMLCVCVLYTEHVDLKHPCTNENHNIGLCNWHLKKLSHSFILSFFLSNACSVDIIDVLL